MLPLTIVSLVPQVGRVPKGADEDWDVVLPVCILHLKDDVNFREKWGFSKIGIIRQVESQPISRDLCLDIEAFDPTVFTRGRRPDLGPGVSLFHFQRHRNTGAAGSGGSVQNMRGDILRLSKTVQAECGDQG